MNNDLTKAGGGVFGVGIGLIALYLAMPQVTSLIGIALVVMGLGFAIAIAGIAIDILLD